MDTNSGKIHMVADEDFARRKGLIPLTPEEHEHVRYMAPEQRREWAAHREVIAALRCGGLTANDPSERNRLKAQRRRRR